jgi:ATP-binding protein involved in chromosome partitioning
VIAEPDSPIALVYQELARHVGARIVLQEAATRRCRTSRQRRLMI